MYKRQGLYFNKLYTHKKTLAIDILQKAKVNAGIESTYLIINAVELTDNKATPSIKYNRDMIKLLWKIV